jgi:NAD(P)-dependent dehydrogenase (short-subunit alcohol dehydrogenase family)
VATSERSVFVTGGGAGIGAATVAAFVRDGHRVGVLDTDIAAGRVLEERFGRDACRFFAGDVRRGADLAAAVTATERAFGSLGVVFANAGLHRFNTILDVTDTDLDLLVDVNIKGTVKTLAETVPRLVAAGGGAVVINASDQALIGKRNSLVYGLTKGALGQMTKSLALDLAPHGIRVNAVCPGTTRTRLTEAIFDRLPDPAAAWAAEAATYPAGRVGTAEDVAELVVFLASDRAGFITGSLHSVDGGLTAG